jgi:hypothetical protein
MLIFHIDTFLRDIEVAVFDGTAAEVDVAAIIDVAVADMTVDIDDAV